MGKKVKIVLLVIAFSVLIAVLLKNNGGRENT